MEPVVQIVVMLMLAGGLRVTAGTETTALPLDPCPSGYAWDSKLQDCLDCDVCDSMPETSICPGCKGAVPSISNDNSFQKLAAKVDTANVYTCPDGYGWDPVNSDCMSCSVCKETPNTNICEQCAQGASEHGLIAVISVLALVAVCAISVIAWLVWNRRVKAKDDAEIRQPIQESGGPEEITDKETVV
ncbi:Tumor necrosis factor receptor super, member 12a [Branchiostoma belcheri]|nr:Tumor necrosis factor receptor super, member 12a [Branchiostoma belcheri]